MRAVIAFSETLPAEAPLKGIKYDVEPYGTKEWKAKGPAREAVKGDYLAFLRKARSVLHEEAPRLWLAADTPFWWDKDEFVLDFEGRRKRLSEHIQDLTDFIVVMSYRRTLPKVLDCVESERRYARQIHKVIFPSLETLDLKQDPHISLWETPNEEFRKMVPQFLEIAKEDPAMGGVMIHCYRSLFEKLTRDTLTDRRRRLPNSLPGAPVRGRLRIRLGRCAGVDVEPRLTFSNGSSTILNAR